MSAVVADSCFLSALQPNSSCTAYVLPSGPAPDSLAKARRVQEQVRMRLAEKKSSSLPRLDDSAAGSTDHSLPAGKTYSHGFSSRSMIHTPSRIMANNGKMVWRFSKLVKKAARDKRKTKINPVHLGCRQSVATCMTRPLKVEVPTVPLQSSGFSSRSALETSSKVNRQATSTVQSNFQTYQSQSRSRRSKSLCQADQEGIPLIVLDHPENASCPTSVPPSGTLRRSLSGILAQERGYLQEELPSQYTYKGPSHRTISRITNRQQHYQQQGSTLEKDGWKGTSRGFPMAGDVWGTQWQQHVSRTNHAMGTAQYQATLQRAASLRSLRSVGKGVDILDGASIHSNDALGELHGLDMATAVRYLSESDTVLQILGAAYVQHQCYHSNDAKNQVRVLHGIPALVQLFTSENQEVQRYATGAMRNLIYENSDNKVALIDASGVTRLVSILKEPDEELRKTITGVLWNLSSRDNLKEKLSKEALPELTETILVPLCNTIPLNPSEREIFNNTSGCLRNLSSVNDRTRQKMRDMRGLVDALVSYIQQEERGEDKGLENCLCVMRNLSYQLYTELPPSVQLRLEGQTRASASRDHTNIDCFTLYSKKSSQNQNLSIMSEVPRQPKGSEWLWHPKVVALYKFVLEKTDISSTSREAAIGALQNITTGETRWASVLTGVVIEQERMLPLLLDLLDTNSDLELRSLTGLLRNLARHSTNKDYTAKNMVNVLVSKLPSDGHQKTPSSEVVVNICGALNHLVSRSSMAARDISYFNGLPKLVGIKSFHDNSSGRLKAARAASTVLCNMFQYNKLHKDYKLKGFARRDFTDTTI
ncbi:plakophilin-3-like isoform X2 [Echeneis naucrates]|uniref:plakophilin-3-like isoform X2 n=1 Tax=Echeneis naucrates TaxID=173247 RepID=UPI001113384B|nr:plakophilin-3-like isoform X2 [Echeneis naucrates]